MKYMGMPSGMWTLYKRSFQAHLTSVLGFGEAEAARITVAAKPKYKEIIQKLPEFEKADRFKMNIVNCAMLAAFLLNMEKKPEVESLTAFYEQAMMIAPTRWFCRLGGKSKFSERDLAGMKATAALNAADRNPYSWNMEFLPYPDLQSKKPGAGLVEEVSSGLLAVVKHFNVACCCCQRVLSLFSLPLLFFSVGVVIFAVTVVTLDLAVITIPAVFGHKKRAAGESLISESP